MSGGGEPGKKAPELPDINSQLEWIRFREETLGPAAYSEAPSSKMWRKITENPFVPIGAMATFGALSYGLWCFRKGRMRDSQMMMRVRIGAQGFTIVALLAGVYFGASTVREPPPAPIRAEASPAKKDSAKS